MPALTEPSSASKNEEVSSFERSEVKDDLGISLEGTA